jgi:DNA-directed RNA polymerase specialized sigma24 family protein
MLLSLCAFRRWFFTAVPKSDQSAAEARQLSFQKLDGLSRRVIRLRQFEKFSFREIADVVGKPETEIKAIWIEGLCSLKHSLAGDSAVFQGR